MNISVIIPNYNGIKLLKKNLPHLFQVFSKYKNGNVEIILIDDSSQDESVVYIQEFINTVKNNNISVFLLQNVKNSGFSITVNSGVKHATGEILLLLNTDVIVSEDFLKSLLPHFSDPSVFAVGCNEKTFENNVEKHYGRGKGRWQRGFLIHSAADIHGTSTLWVSCGSGAFSKKIWNALGGLDVLYSPFYWEDIDISYRAAKSGYKLLFEENSLVTHEHDKGAIKSSYNQFDINVIAYRNQFIFVWKNVTGMNLKIQQAIWLPYHFFNALLRGDVAFFYGFISAILKAPAIIRSASEAKKLFIKSDQEVVQKINPKSNVAVY